MRAINNQVEQFIEQRGLLNRTDRIIVGFSGGADSVVLLHLLNRLGYDCIAAHCNFHLRGEESERDERFAAEFAGQLGIPFCKIDFRTCEIARERGISIEMAARDLRYEWFEELRVQHQASVIAVAHHRDDSVETFLLNMIRGTGIRGLTGIKARNGNLVRPLLCLSKEDILSYCKQESLSFVTDSSNLKEDFTRNKIRLQLIPLMQTLNPSVQSALMQTMENLEETAKVYAAGIDSSISQVYNKEMGEISIPALLATPSPEAVLYELLKTFGFNKETVHDVLFSINTQSGKTFYSETHCLSRERQFFQLSSKNKIPTPDIYWIDSSQAVIDLPIRMSVSRKEIGEDFSINKDRNTAQLDADKLQFPLMLRRWNAGDRFQPFGMKGFQKMSDYFNNNKFSSSEKENTWLLCSGEMIVWVVGHRIDDRFSIKKATKCLCEIKLL